jgi:hypothetical protein
MESSGVANKIQVKHIIIVIFRERGELVRDFGFLDPKITQIQQKRYFLSYSI